MKTKWWSLVVGVISVFFVVYLSQAYIDPDFKQDYLKAFQKIEELEDRIKKLEDWKKYANERLDRLAYKQKK